LSSSIRQRRPMGQSKEDIAAHQEEKNFVDFIYNTNQTLQSLSQGMVGLSLSYEKNLHCANHNLKLLQIEFENLDKFVRQTVAEVSMDVSDKILGLTHIADEIYEKTEDIYDNFARLDDVASVQLQLEDKISDLEKSQCKYNSSHDCSLTQLKGQIKAQIDDLRRLISQPDKTHQQCAQDLQIKRNEDLVTIKGLQLEIDRLKKQCDYNQKQFEHVVNQINRLKGDT